MPNGVQLDFSRAQPIPKRQTKVTLDFSKAQPITPRPEPPSQTVGIWEALNLPPKFLRGDIHQALLDRVAKVAEAHLSPDAARSVVLNVGSALSGMPPVIALQLLQKYATPLNLMLAGTGMIGPVRGILARSLLARILGRTASGAFGASGLLDAFSGRRKGETQADYVERILGGLSQVALGASGAFAPRPMGPLKDIPISEVKEYLGRGVKEALRASDELVKDKASDLFENVAKTVDDPRRNPVPVIDANKHAENFRQTYSRIISEPVREVIPLPKGLKVLAATRFEAALAKMGIKPEDFPRLTEIARKNRWTFRDALQVRTELSEIGATHNNAKVRLVATEVAKGITQDLYSEAFKSGVAEDFALANDIHRKRMTMHERILGKLLARGTTGDDVLGLLASNEGYARTDMQSLGKYGLNTKMFNNVLDATRRKDRISTADAWAIRHLAGSLAREFFGVPFGLGYLAVGFGINRSFSGPRGGELAGTTIFELGKRISEEESIPVPKEPTRAIPPPSRMLPAGKTIPEQGTQGPSESLAHGRGFVILPGSKSAVLMQVRPEKIEAKAEPIRLPRGARLKPSQALRLRRMELPPWLLSEILKRQGIRPQEAKMLPSGEFPRAVPVKTYTELIQRRQQANRIWNVLRFVSGKSRTVPPQSDFTLTETSLGIDLSNQNQVREAMNRILGKETIKASPKKSVMPQAPLVPPPSREGVPRAAEAQASVPSHTPVSTAKPMAVVVAGAPTKLLTASGGEIPVLYAVVEASSLVTSHNPNTFSINPAYPVGVQERAYDLSPELQQSVISHSQEYDPSFTVNTNPDAINGPPVVTHSGIVLGGNNRAMSTIRMYGLGRGKGYIESLSNHAGTFNLNPEEIKKMREPVLVRVLQNDPGSQELARKIASDLNVSFTNGLTIAERAVSAGRSISAETFQSLGRLLEESGPDATIRDVLRTNPKQLISSLQADGIISEQNRATLIDAHTGMLNEDGREFIERAFVGAVIDDVWLLENAPKSSLAKIEQSLGELSRLKIRGDEWDITAFVRQALRHRVQIVSRGMRAQDYLSQGRMFGGSPSIPVSKFIEFLGQTTDGGVTGRELRTKLGAFQKEANRNVRGQAGFEFAPPPDAWTTFNDVFGTSMTEDQYVKSLTEAAEEERRLSGSTKGAR